MINFLMARIDTSDDIGDYLNLRIEFRGVFGQIKAYDYKDDQIGFMNFEYCLDGKLYINDFQSDRLRIGIGRRMNEYLLNSIERIREVVESQGYNNRINCIEGEIVPREKRVSTKELRIIYGKLGYQIIDNLIFYNLS